MMADGLGVGQSFAAAQFGVLGPLQVRVGEVIGAVGYPEATCGAGDVDRQRESTGEHRLAHRRRLGPTAAPGSAGDAACLHLQSAPGDGRCGHRPFRAGQQTTGLPTVDQRRSLRLRPLYRREKRRRAGRRRRAVRAGQPASACRARPMARPGSGGPQRLSLRRDPRRSSRRGAGAGLHRARRGRNRLRSAAYRDLRTRSADRADTAIENRCGRS